MPAPQPSLALAALAVLCGVLDCATVRAQPSELVELTWNAPVGCPKAAQVQARIRKLAASAGPSGRTLRAEATITRRPRGALHLRLVIRAGTLVGVRNLEGGSCDALAGAAAVNLALLLSSRGPLSAQEIGAPPASQPSAAAPARTELQMPKQPSASETQPKREQSRESDTSDELDEPTLAGRAEAGDGSTRSWRGLLELPLSALELGPMPEPSLGGAVGAGVWVDRWRILAEGNLWLRQKLSVTAPLAAGANVDRLTATLRICRTFPFGRFELAPCAHTSLRRVSTHGTGMHIASRTKASTWVAAGAGAQARYHLAGWLALLASVDASIEGSRPRISIDGVGRLGQIGSGAVRTTLGTEWIL